MKGSLQVFGEVWLDSQKSLEAGRAENRVLGRLVEALMFPPSRPVLLLFVAPMHKKPPLEAGVC